MSDRQISEGGEEKAASVSQEAKSTPEKERINESKVNTPKSTSSRPVSSRSTATKKKKKSLTIAAGDGEEDPQPEMSDDEIIGRYVEGVRDAHKELRRSLLFQQKLIEKCRSLKSELVEKCEFSFLCMCCSLCRLTMSDLLWSCSLPVESTISQPPSCNGLTV